MSIFWMTRRVIAHRRLAHDYKRDPAISEAMIRWAAINTIDPVGCGTHWMLT